MQSLDSMYIFFIITGQRLLHDSYTYWAKGQPGVFGGLEDCALLEFRNGGHWHDYACEGVLFNLQNHAWVCEYGNGLVISY